MIRRLFATIAVVALCVGLAACEGRSTATAGAEQGQETKSAPKAAPGSKVGDQVGQTGSKPD